MPNLDSLHEHLLDVAIVGAGPAGLSTAAALTRSHNGHLSLKVFDHVRAFGKSGAGVGLRLNGFAALNAIDVRLYEAVVSLTSCNRTNVKHTLKGLETASTTYPAVQGKPTIQQMDAAAAGAVGALGAGWAELRNTLAQFVPDTAICLNRRFSRLEPHADYVILHFTDGTSVRARLVIGADGSFSKVRQQTVADGPPDFSGTVFWRAWLTSRSLPQDEAHVFLPAPNSTDDNVTGVIYPIGGKDQHVWTTSASAARMQQVGVALKAADRSRQDNTTGNAQPSAQASCTECSLAATYLDNKQREAEPQQLGMLQRCKRVWGDNAAIMQDVMDATDESSILEHSLYTRPPEGLGMGHWGVGRVTLVGDAAHPMRPIAGQGVNQALEDAVMLAHTIKDGGLTASSLRTYEAARTPRLKEIAAFQIVAGLKLYSNCPKDLPENLQGYKHAATEWHGNGVGLFNEWLMDRHFAPLSACNEE